MDKLLTWSSQHLEEPPFESGKPLEKNWISTVPTAATSSSCFSTFPGWWHTASFRSANTAKPSVGCSTCSIPPEKAVSDNNPDYWNAVPLITGTAPKPGQSSYAIQGPQDPHQIALSHPVHFRKALYMLYIDILLNRGDTAYRELTPRQPDRREALVSARTEPFGPTTGYQANRSMGSAHVERIQRGAQ